LAYKTQLHKDEMKACQLSRTIFPPPLPPPPKKNQIYFQKQLLLLDSGGFFVDLVINSIINYVLRLAKYIGF
jgi:hypothetical protein